MDAREYLRKATQICRTFDDDNCSRPGYDCPLKCVKCGIPDKAGDQDKVIRIVETYEAPRKTPDA